MHTVQYGFFFSLGAWSLSAYHRSLFAFLSYFWKRSSSWDGITTKSVRSVWPGISKIDAAYEYKRSDTAIFFEGVFL